MGSGVVDEAAVVVVDAATEIVAYFEDAVDTVVEVATFWIEI